MLRKDMTSSRKRKEQRFLWNKFGEAWKGG